MGELKAKESRRFEDIRHLRAGGGEFWSTREPAPVLDYTQWRNFTEVIGKAMIACNNSGHDVICDFAEVGKIVDADMGSTGLIANLLRRSQTEETFKRSAVDNPADANAAHYAVGRGVRAAIERVGGVMPEDLPAPEKELLAELKRRARKNPPVLDE